MATKRGRGRRLPPTPIKPSILHLPRKNINFPDVNYSPTRVSPIQHISATSHISSAPERGEEFPLKCLAWIAGTRPTAATADNASTRSIAQQPRIAEWRRLDERLPGSGARVPRAGAPVRGRAGGGKVRTNSSSPPQFRCALSLIGRMCFSPILAPAGLRQKRRPQLRCPSRTLY